MVELAELEQNFAFAYEDDQPLWEKIDTLAKKIYRAEGIEAPAAVRKKIEQLQAQGYGGYPVCVAKTQYSFSSDASLLGAPTGHTLAIREVRLSAGAEFIVVICGSIMTMLGLPKVPAANHIDLNEEGKITGLF